MYSRWTAGGLLLALSGGCSFFYDLNANQCERTSDCEALGPAFEDSICVNRVCVLPGGGNGGSSGNDNGGNGGTGDTGGGGTGNNSGTAGTGGMPECTTHAECIAAHENVPYMCREERCIELLTPECPLLIPQSTQQWSALAALEQHDPLLLGAYSNLDATTPSDTLAVVSWEFALTEINEATGGGPLFGRDRRPVMALVCNGSADLDASMTHMMTDLGIPGVLSSLNEEDLITTFTTDAAAEAEPLIISARSADNRLVSLSDNGRIWHMLGNPRELAEPVAALVKTRIEPIVQERRAAFFAQNSATAENPDDVPLRVLLVRAEDLAVSDVADLLVSEVEEEEGRPQNNLVFNGFPAFAPENQDNFAIANVDSIQVTSSPDISDVMVKVRALKPHIIVAMTTGEFLMNDALPAIENQWDAATMPIAPDQPPPFYVFSHRMILSSASLAGLSATFSNRELASRMVGVNYASASDTIAAMLKTTFGEGITRAYPDSQHVEDLPETENFYDAAYYMAYSLLGSIVTGREPTGELLLFALENRLMDSDQNAEIANVGSFSVADIVSGLSRPTYSIRLRGTMGLPDFDPILGTRESEISAWCFELDDTLDPPAWVRRNDVSRYDTENEVFTSDLPCITGP